VPQAISADRLSVDAETDPSWWVRLVRWPRSKLIRPPDVRPYLVGELLVVLCLLRVYDFARGRADVRKSEALHYGARLLQLERTLHIDIEPAINRWTVEHHPISLIASYWYQFAHLTITLSVLLWVWRWHPAIYRRARNALVVINLVGLTIFLLLPVAPPRLLPGAGFIDADRLAGFGTNNVGPVSADAYGAFPSLHIAWALWTAVVAFSLLRHRRFGWLCLGYPLLTFFAIVATGNHYVLDAVAGAVLGLVALKLVGFRLSGSLSGSVPANSGAGDR
jgi:membrane-associated phospholipid phosphatase